MTVNNYSFAADNNNNLNVDLDLEFGISGFMLKINGLNIIIQGMKNFECYTKLISLEFFCVENIMTKTKIHKKIGFVLSTHWSVV